MRLLFMGTATFSVPVLDSLIESEHELIGVVTQPDRPAGRGHRVRPSPVKERAQEAGLGVLQPKRASARTFIETLRELSPDLIAVVAYGQILKRAVLDLPPRGCLNVHPSLLPKYRGAAPIHRAILDGENETGVTIMLLDEGEDTGDIVLQQRVAIAPEDTSVTLAEKLADAAGPLLLQAIDLAVDGPPPHRPQDHSQATHAPKLTKAEAPIDWTRTARSIHDQIRGMQPWPGTMAHLPDGSALKIWKSQTGNFPGEESTRPGTIHITAERELWVQTGEGGLELQEVQPANKRAMSAQDFINGYQIQTGAQLSTD